MQEAKVSIIVPIFNGKDYTLKFLDTVYNLNYTNFEVIIIDDGSTDGSADAIKETYPQTIVLEGDGDFWWAKSMNVGVEYALKNGTDFIFTLNNDIEIDKNIINAHLECYKQFPKSVIGSKVLDKQNPEIVINAYGKKNLLFPPNFNFTPDGKIDCPEYTKIKEADAIAGMGTFMPAEIFKEIGFYNHEAMPQYLACIEHSLRAQKNDYKIIFNPNAKLWNNTESTWRFPKKITLQSLKNLLFHKRSGYLLKANFYLYYHYWPKLIWFIPFSLLYLKCFAGLFISQFSFGKALINNLRKKNIILKN